jgi:hypothetical protein
MWEGRVVQIGMGSKAAEEICMKEYNTSKCSLQQQQQLLPLLKKRHNLKAKTNL